MKKFFRSPLFFPLILVAAIAFVVFQVKTKAPVEHEQVGYPVKAVEVIAARELPFRARATAFGNIEPSVVVNAKSEVSGKIVYVHPDLHKGASIAQGEVVLRIEPTTFKISLDQSQAGLQGSLSSLAQLEAEEASTRLALEIAQDNLKVGQKELERQRALQEKKLVARSDLDREVQKVLNLRQQVQDIQGKLSSYNSRKAATLAQITQSQSQVAQSEDTLGRTEVSMPIDARIGEVLVEKGEFVPAGAVLFEALGVQAVEINAQLPVQQFRPLVAGMGKSGASALVNLQSPADLQNVVARMQLEVRVRLVGDTDGSIYWEGQLLRLSESVDPVRDTLGMVVEVANPYAGIIPGKKPPLLKGMSTAVEFYSQLKPTLILPRKAVHQGRVYIADENNQLVIEPVHIQFMQGNMMIPDEQSASRLAGRNIIISDVIPVMQGLPLKVIHAEDYEQELARRALGL
ncbi:MAG: HlyD family secretion protein [Proteobacteria bacterium]|nr:HlyD family secretion protein [Pseudomonadota bacterium]